MDLGVTEADAETDWTSVCVAVSSGFDQPCGVASNEALTMGRVTMAYWEVGRSEKGEVMTRKEPGRQPSLQECESTSGFLF